MNNDKSSLLDQAKTLSKARLLKFEYEFDGYEGRFVHHRKAKPKGKDYTTHFLFLELDAGSLGFIPVSSGTTLFRDIIQSGVGLGDKLAILFNGWGDSGGGRRYKRWTVLCEKASGSVPFDFDGGGAEKRAARVPDPDIPFPTDEEIPF
jgi:hypothetical protein